MKDGLIIVRREHFDAFLSGNKVIEYRRHRGQWNNRNYFIGRRVCIRDNYNPAHARELMATIADTQIASAREIGPLSSYPDLDPDDSIFLILLDIDLGRPAA